MFDRSLSNQSPGRVARRGFLAGIGALAGLAVVERGRRTTTGVPGATMAGDTLAPSTQPPTKPSTTPQPPTTPQPLSTQPVSTQPSITTPPPVRAELLASPPPGEPPPPPGSAVPSQPELMDAPAPEPAPALPGSFRTNALFVSLYGFPHVPVLGCLGEQDAAATVFRAQLLASAYDQFAPDGKAVPALEIIATVASPTPGADGTFSAEHPVSIFQPFIEAATAAGVHLVFDLQPGRATFLDQARLYEELWRLPNVSIALDPEWRVGPDQQPGGGLVGTVDAAEINATIDYIDSVITAHKLPPKMCLVHQFRPVMITNQAQVRGTAQVTPVFQMDGLGPLNDKSGTWARMVENLPAGALTGWKNFYLFDSPVASPEQTMAHAPAPIYVSYQ